MPLVSSLIERLVHCVCLPKDLVPDWHAGVGWLVSLLKMEVIDCVVWRRGERT